VDRGEGDGVNVAVFAGDLKRTLVGLAKDLVLAPSATPPDGADGVDDVVGGEAVAKGEDGLAGGEAGVALAFAEQLGAGGTVDGAVNAASAAELFVGGIDDGVELVRGNVGMDDLNHGTGMTPNCASPLTTIPRRDRCDTGHGSPSIGLAFHTD
jgi:hypothetical protein